MTNKILMSGNEACAEAAVATGCRYFFGYPITPQNEIVSYLAKRLPEKGGVFVQTESEISAINMVFGASLAGGVAMTSSSSPGVSLKQEGISYLAGAELPAVVINMMRGGPGLGNIGPAQGDYFQATRGGGHGDYRCIVLAPHTVQEIYELTSLCFYLAFKYRMTAMILCDGLLAQMMEPVDLDTKIHHVNGIRKDWVLDGCKGRDPRVIKTLFVKDGELREHNLRLHKKYLEVSKNENRLSLENIKDAEIVLVGYGSCARLCYEVMQSLRAKGIKAGLIRPISLWPFPYKQIKEAVPSSAKVLVVEMSMGQMIEDIKLSLSDQNKIYFYGVPGGDLPFVHDIEDIAQKILKNKYEKYELI